MRRALLCAAFVILACVRSAAQDAYEYFYNNTSPEEQSRELGTDMGLFMAPLGGRGALFRSLSDFNFSAVKYNRRGYSQDLTRDFWADIDLSGLVSRSADFGFLNILKRSDYLRTENPGANSRVVNFGLGAAVNRYPAELGAILQPGVRATVFAYNRRGRLGGRFSVAGEVDAVTDGYAGVSFGHRWGRDPNVGGVFSEEPHLLTGFDLGLGNGHRVSLLFGMTGSNNGLRSYATAEAFELTGDNYYNPSWGYYGNKELSAKTIESVNAFPILHYSGSLSRKTTLTASAYYGLGLEKRSGLSWFNAQNPYPDYYRYMPDYEPSNLAQGWLAGDPRVTQIYWDQLAGQNLGRPDQAAYIFANRVERTRNLQFAAAATTTIDSHFSLTYGVRYNSDRREYYREMESLLGAGPMRDVDQYLLDDDIFGEYHLNDKRNPDRLVNEGDRFGYSYRLLAAKADVWAVLGYDGGRFRATAALEIGHGTLQREGLYEKELFPGNGSYGRSDKFTFNPYTARVSAGYSFSGRHLVGFSAMVAETMPYAGTVFLNPDYSNYAVARPQTVRILSADADYTMAFDRLTLNASAFVTSTSGESAVYRYWDDIESVYADMSVAGIDKLYYGAELAAQWDLSARFALNFAASVGSYTYDSDPAVTIIDDATRHTIVTASKSHLDGYNLATSPRRAVTGELRYNSWGWIASLTASWMGGRYVDVSPLRRMERAYGLAGSPEKHREFTDQESLGDAFVMNLFLLRSFRINKGTLTLLASANNLLGNTDIIYNGYEQMRIVKSGTAPNYNWKPFPSKYLYSYGRTYHVSLSYSF